MIITLKANGKSIRQQFIEAGVDMDFPCGGNGTCGKCKVRFVVLSEESEIEGIPEITEADRKALSEDELRDGYRLACKAEITRDCLVEVDKTHVESDTNAVKTEENNSFENSANKGQVEKAEKTAIAIDIGTTTIAASAVVNDNNEEVEKRTITLMNSQKVYGADVISRIKASNDGHGEKLHELVTGDIKRIVSVILDRNEELSIEKDRNINGENSPQLVIAGNTTMMHLLFGDSCEGLGKAPYKPERLNYPDVKLLGKNCYIFPGISAFVGGDIVAGMYALSFDKIPKGKTYMLIDLGTNGEMAIADSDRITVCSTAAGPVFEGGEISCGMAGVAGAIEHVEIQNASHSLVIKTIGNIEPCGICGSGVLETVSELRRCGIIDETGLLLDEYFDDGIELAPNIRFTQNDIRQVQLAKAAIRSGIDTLLKEHGVTAADIDKVYLAGGFSLHLDPEKVKYLHMLPDEFIENKVIECVGNTSLAGCEKYIKNQHCNIADNSKDNKTEDETAGLTNPGEEINSIVCKSTEVVLANTDTFTESYIEAMNF